MNTNLHHTPSANRLHIGIFGKRNAGKSTFINHFTNQSVSIVSNVPGTTTDPVYKSMEINEIGACTIIDTAGFDDTDNALGRPRIEKTRLAANKTDIALIVCATNDVSEFSHEEQYIQYFKSRQIPVFGIVTKGDPTEDNAVISFFESQQIEYISYNSTQPTARTELVALLKKHASSTLAQNQSITGDLCQMGDVVMLVMPQDLQAPKGRLILPQVQTTRELLDKGCSILSTTTDQFSHSLAQLKQPPHLIITDSQVFAEVFEQKPTKSKLTSFSVLFAGYKGDIDYYIEGAKHLSKLTPTSRVLIAEACTHVPVAEDIGRIKIPRMIRQHVGDRISIDIVCGNDYPENLRPYDLVIQCGACMFTRTHVLSRIDRAKNQSVPMTNYGVAIAYYTGILDQIETTSN